MNQECISKRVDKEPLSRGQKDRLAEKIHTTLRRTCDEQFPGLDYGTWAHMLPEPLLDLMVELIACEGDNVVAADTMRASAVALVFQDLAYNV
ncbi:hypothetical protein ACFWXK_10180 [Streptomyces sp. NPDC059070]|uniref:hypothetical protein n=1 Tax=Streptomyces sp. NPDC059070 TaxID=3346713 RepID=UPI0036CB6FF7